MLSEAKHLKVVKKILPLLFLLSFSSSLFAATGTKVMVATQHPYATEVALEVLQLGGNAVDAAVAAQWMLNVVEPQSSGIGGGGFFVFYEAATKRIYTFDGREAAPAEAFPEMFLDSNGNPYPEQEAMTGGLPAGVPGVLKLLKTVHDRFGSKAFSFAELFDPAIQIAENGFEVTPRLARFIEQQKDRLKLFESSRAIFFNAQDQPLQTGEVLIQKDLGNTFRLIQREGIRVFYEGAMAQDIVKAVRTAPFHPGLMKLEDLQYYQVKERDPVHGEYRDFSIFSMGPPSSGGTTLIETLNILDHFDISQMKRSPDFFHVFSEAQKLAFVDRNAYLGDPDFVKTPLDALLSEERAEKFFKMIRPDASISLEQPLLPLESPNTSHISIVDAEGNIVSYTTTIEHIFGSALVVPGRGFFLNNELSDFDLAPKDENGKLKANAPGSEKRPRSSMTPTIVFNPKGEPVLVLGSPGSTAIIAAVLNTIVNYLDFKMPLKEAVSAPRLLNRTGVTEMEAPLFNDQALRTALEGKGDLLKSIPPFGNVQAIALEYGPPVLIGESDPRGEGKAEGF
jgi:gamma-glutamyltranspeptidase/glutathione hydrolase